MANRYGREKSSHLLLRGVSDRPAEGEVTHDLDSAEQREPLTYYKYRPTVSVAGRVSSAYGSAICAEWRCTCRKMTTAGSESAAPHRRLGMQRPHEQSGQGSCDYDISVSGDGRNLCGFTRSSLFHQQLARTPDHPCAGARGELKKLWPVWIQQRE